MQLSGWISVLSLLILQGFLVDSGLANSNHDKKGVGHRHNLYKVRLSEASERIKRAQANARALPKKHNKRQASVVFSSTATSSAPNTEATTPAYIGRQNDTSTCTNQPTSDGCTDPVYTVGTGSIDLSNGGTMPANGHVNFQYIPYSQYTGSGSYRSKPSTWSPVGCGMHFDPNNNQPGGAYIGKGSFPFSAACTLPAEGYCIIWVQYSNANQHYGEGGQGPVCFPGTASVPSTSASTTAASTSKASSSSSGALSSSSSPSSSSSSSMPSSTKPTSTSTSSSAAPSVTGTVAAWGQCGGVTYTGPTSCEAGYVCVFSDTYYSQCKPGTSSSSSATTSSSSSSSSSSTIASTSSSSATPAATGTGTGVLYEQCGGTGWTGAQGCVAGLTCVKSSDWYSQCLAPACANSYYSQCGGQGYTGATCCPAPYSCKVVNAWYSQCQA